MKRIFSLYIVLFLFCPQISLAATPSLSPTASPLPSASITDKDLASVRSPALTRLIRFFKSRSQASYYRDSLKLANFHLLGALAASRSGDTVRAEKLLAEYQKELQKVQDFITNQAHSSDLKAASLKDQLLLDNALHITALDSLATAKAQVAFNRKVLDERLKIIKKMGKILSSDKTPEQIQKKLDKLTDKLAEKDAKAQAKLERKLAFLADLDNDEAEDNDLDEAIEKEEQAALERHTPELDEDEIEGFAERNASHARRLEVIKRVLERAPESARPALRRVLDAMNKKALDETVGEVMEKAEKVEKESEDGKSKINIESKLKTNKKNSGSSKTNIKVDVNGEKTELKSESSGESSDGEESRSHTTKIALTISDSSCGSDLETSKGAEVEIKVTNNAANAQVYSIEGIQSVTIKPGSSADLKFTATASGNYTIRCGNGKTATFTIN